VGDGDSDHLCWERAEDMSTPRTAFKIDTNHAGSEVAAETAAALAAASKAFRPYDSMYADLLLLHAKQVQCCVCRNACMMHLFLYRVMRFRVLNVQFVPLRLSVVPVLVTWTALHVRRHVQRQVR